MTALKYFPYVMTLFMFILFCEHPWPDPDGLYHHLAMSP